MLHIIRFWDLSRRSPIPVAIDFLVANSLPDAIAKATKQRSLLKKRLRCRIGYDVVDGAGHRCQMW